MCIYTHGSRKCLSGNSYLNVRNILGAFQSLAEGVNFSVVFALSTCMPLLFAARPSIRLPSPPFAAKHVSAFVVQFSFIFIFVFCLPGSHPLTSASDKGLVGHTKRVLVFCAQLTAPLVDLLVYIGIRISTMNQYSEKSDVSTSCWGSSQKL